MINAILAVAILATTQVYRLELDVETNIPSIVGADGVKRQVCLVDPAEYAMMTGRVDQVWRSLNATDSGRRQLHGKIVRTEIDATNAVKVTVYGDGYRFSELIPAKRSEARKDRKAAVRQRIRDNRISERQQKFREALEARKDAPVKEVTLEHNAATGKDRIVIQDGINYDHKVGAYLGKEGWYSCQAGQRELHEQRVRDGREKCAICEKEISK